MNTTRKPTENTAAPFEHNPTPQQLDWLNANLPNENPVVLDVTAGGGSIPFEAGRLGFRAIANELNPVAGLILRATCQWPQRHGYPLLNDYRECAEAFPSPRQRTVGRRLSRRIPPALLQRRMPPFPTLPMRRLLRRLANMFPPESR